MNFGFVLITLLVVLLAFGIYQFLTSGSKQQPRGRRILHDGYFQYIETDELGRTRQFLQTQDSVCILLHVVDKEYIILVQQPREAMIHADNPSGEIVELVAGRFDRDLDVVELAVKEAFEESGAVIRPEQIEILNHGQPMATCAGALTERTYICYAPITADQLGPDQETFSADGEDERIKRIVIPIAELDSYTCAEVRVWGAIRELQLRLERQGDKHVR